MPPSRPSVPGPSTMERFALGLLLVAQLVLLFLAGRALSQAESCPFHCICQNLSDSLSTLCTHKGLLSVPPHIDRRTVELRLADNFIGAVESADFLNMSGLVELTLSRNALVTLGPLAFGDLESLRSLHLDGNRLARIPPEALRGLLNLQHLILNNNQLEEIAAEAFDDFLLTLEDLDLAYNNLRQVPWAGIGAMLCLHTLNLDHNLIEAVAEGALGQLEQLSRLDMTSNRLHTLPPDPLFARAQVGVPGPPTTPWAPALSLSFGGNPLHCNCELLWLRRLARPDDLETCASPAAVAGRYFWSVPEEEFTCEPPLITRHTHTLWVLEGQRATLRCRAIGDPEPTIHWVSPDDKIVGNSSRTASFRNGTLDLLVTTLRDGGGYTCIAINAAGEATAPVGLKIIPLPHRGGGGQSNATAAQADPGSSDITTSAKAAANAAAANASDEGEAVEEGGVEVSEVTATSALVRWGPERPAFAAWMYQIQYNCTADETLVYRIIPATLRHFRLKHLVPGADYALCLLAIFDDVATSLAATHLLGCAHFATREAYPDCRALQAHFLGGTLTVIVGGVLVASLLVFTVVMMVKHKVCGSTHGGSGGAHPLPKVTHVHSQTNGGHPNGGQRLLLQRTPPKEHSGPSRARRPERRAKAGDAAWCLPPGAKAKRSNSLDMAEASPNACYGYAKRLSFLWSKRSQSVHGMLAQGGTGSMEDNAAVAATQRIGPFLNTDELEESVV